MLRKKICLEVLLFTVTFLIPFCSADFSPGDVNVQVWADKVQYTPGETVTLRYTIVNAKPATSVFVYNITFKCKPWYMYVTDHWEGNQTIKLNRAMGAGDKYSNVTTLTVPNDGRAFVSGNYAVVDVEAKVLDGSNVRTIGPSSVVYVGIANPPVHFALRDMDTLILLMSVQIILIVACSALLAGAVFLSGRRPRDACDEAPTNS
jgi:hypothetical protein